MTTHAIRLTRGAAAARRPAASGVLHFVSGYYLLLPIGAAVALLWANTAPESYFTVARLLAFPVNSIAMVFFFGLLAQELLEETIPGGALHHRRRWPVPLIAAAGGTLGAAAAYTAWRP